MFEVALVFDAAGDVLAWHEPRGRTATSIPDSRPLWQLLWEHRANLGGVAHTHPTAMGTTPSREDLTTFAASVNLAIRAQRHPFGVVEAIRKRLRIL